MPIKETPVKMCADCKEFKPLSEFYKRKQTPDGRAYYCRECMKKRTLLWIAKNREHFNAYQRGYRKANPEKAVKWRDDFVKRHPDALKASRAKAQRKYAASHKEIISFRRKVAK
jgi:hypothetical protein